MVEPFWDVELSRPVTGTDDSHAMFSPQGQSKIADQLRKSYSLNDLSQTEDDTDLRRQDSDVSELDDETGQWHCWVWPWSGSTSGKHWALTKLG